MPIVDERIHGVEEIVRKAQNLDLLSLKRSESPVQRAVPKPRNPLPPNPLPKWANLPLQQKLPVVPAPPGKFPASVGKLGDSVIFLIN